MSTLNERSNPIAKAVKLALLATASTVAFTPSAVFAAEEEEASEERIIITGSRIRRQEFTAESPVTVVDSQQFELGGIVNTEDMINTLPQAIPGLDKTSNNPGNGTATINLRGLGSNRTLILLNGTRALPTSEGGVVDINTIPTALIQRVEVLTGGASAVYGSDAVAGVVNFILKDDFEGVQVDAGYNITAEGDGQVFSTNFTMGGNFDSGKGNIVFNMSYTSRDALFQGDRDFAFFAQFDTTDDDGNILPLINGGSTGIPQLAIFSGGFTTSGFSASGRTVFNPDGSIRPFVSSGSDNDFYNYAPVNFITVPQERQQSSVLGHYEYMDGHEVYGRALFTSSIVDQQLAPTPIFQTSSFTLDGNPFIPVASQQIISDAIGEGVDTDGDGIDDTGRALLRRRLLEVGPRFSNNERTSFQFKYGARGEIGDSNWNYDVYYQTGQVINAETQLGNVNRGRFDQALLLDLDADPLGGVCQNTSSNGATIDCAPINVFGQGNISEAGAAFINTAAATVQDTVQKIFGASVAGDSEGLFELPGGPAGVAFGYEYIENSSDFRPSQDVAASTIAGFNGAPASGGEYDVESYFVEILLPVLEGVSGAERLDVSLAFRSSDYSTVGTVTSEKLAVSWAPIDEVLVRASFNTAVRAPNITELFAPIAEGFPGATDPCSGEATDQSAAVAAICTATGVPANVLFSPAIDLPSGQVRSLSGGNPDLNEEEAETQTFGVVYTPFEDLSISLDYFDIEITESVASFGGTADNILSTCYDPSNPTGGVGSDFCNVVNRRADGTIDFVSTRSLNVANESLNGFDINVHYNLDLADGRLDLDYIGTLTEESDTLLSEADLQPGGLGVIECAGAFAGNCGEPTPEYKHRVTARWSIDDFNVQLLWRHIGEVDDDSGGVFVTHIDGTDYFDLSSSFNFGDNYNISGGIRNLFDEKPPILGDNQEQANTFPATYDVLGTSYYFNIRATF